MEKEANIGIDIGLSDLLYSIFRERYVCNQDSTEVTGFIIGGTFPVFCDYAYNTIYLFPYDKQQRTQIKFFVDNVVRERLKCRGIEIKSIMTKTSVHCKLYKP